METGLEANAKSIRKHQVKLARERNRAANNTARVIVKAIEEETGKELSLELCLRIVGMIEEGMA